MSYKLTFPKDIGTQFQLSIQDQQQDGMCPLMLCGFNTMVSGYGYCFRTQENRDGIYNYVMKDINEPN